MIVILMCFKAFFLGVGGVPKAFFTLMVRNFTVYHHNFLLTYFFALDNVSLYLDGVLNIFDGL